MLSRENESSFLEAMQGFGCAAHSQQVLESDGKIHRYRIAGEKSGSLNGWYVLYSDGAVPAGAFGSWKTGDSQNWCAKSERTLSPSEREEWRRKQQEAQQARAAALMVVRQEARNKAVTLLDKAGKAVSDTSERVHPYIQTKGIKPFGVHTLNSSLVISLRNSAGELTSLQFIQADGAKKFLTGGEITGSYFAMGKPLAVIGICEGYATGASLFEAKGVAVVVAFNAGNLPAVARAIRKKFPDVEIIFYADNDQATEGNPGLSKATEAAEQVGGRVLVPTFLPHELIDGKIPTDFNDVHRLRGLDALRFEMEQVSKIEVVVKDAGGR